MAINSVDKLDNNEIKFWIIGKKKMKYTLFDTGRCDDQLIFPPTYYGDQSCPGC